MDIFLAVLGAVLLVVGFLGTFVPVLPGAPLAWCGLLAGYFSCYIVIGIPALVITAVVAVAVSILDNFFPVLMTKKFGGSKEGTWGSTIGLIVGMVIGPVGIIVGPFVGALIGELVHNSSDSKSAFKAAWGAFLGFIFGTGMKMIAVVIFIWIYVLDYLKYFHI